MAIQLVNRYKQLLASVPKGSFYSSDGQVVPHRNTPYELRVSTGAPDRLYEVFLNDRFQGSVQTDGDSVALLLLLLDKGENEIRLVDSVTQESTLAWLTARDYATWMAAEAEVLEGLDTNVEQVLLDARLATSSLALIEDVFGKTVATGNSFGYDLDTYRGLLQELRTAYRYWGGTVEGIARAVRAFTDISPLIYPRSFGPRWILGKDFLFPKTDTSSATLYSNAALSNINAGGAGVSIAGVTSRVGVGTGTVKFYKVGPSKFLSWTPPSGIEGPHIPIDLLTSPRTYTLPAGNKFDLIVSQPGPFNIIAGRNNLLTLNINDIGPITITLTAGGARTAAQISTDINNALNADARYGGAYNATAASYDLFGSGTPMVSLVTPNIFSTESIVILTTNLVDAAQTLFNLPDIRGGLSTGYSTGATTLVLSGSTVMDSWPAPTVDDPLSVIIGRTTFHPLGTPNTAASPATTELVKAIDVNRGTQTLTLAAPGLVNNHNTNEMVYVDGTTPYRRDSVVDGRSITITVNNGLLLPGANTSDNALIEGSGLPDGWVVTTNAGGAPTLQGFQPHTYFELDRDLPFGLSSDHMVEIPIPDQILEYRGFPIYVSFHARVDDPSRAAPQADLDTIEISYDDRTSWQPGVFSAGYIGLDVNAEWRPREFRRIFFIDPTSTKVWIRLKSLAGRNGYTTIHKVRVQILPGIGAAAGLQLGEGTIPRSEQRIKQGAFMYVWSPTPLTAEEKASLGVLQENQVVPGHIDKLAPDMAWLDKFDVSEYDISNNPKNIAGAFSESDFLLGTLTNLDIVLRTPQRFTYLTPTLINETTQTLDFTVSGHFFATLDIPSDQDQTQAILFEGDVPVTRDQWIFTSASQVQLLYPPINAVYSIRYQALIRFETAAIDLGASFADYLWFGDFHCLLRPQITPTLVQVTSGIQFDGEGIATLGERAREDQTLATLLEDTGVTQKVVPVSQWSFLDTNRISVSLDAFEPAALYQFTYMAEANHPTVVVRAKVELRSATSLFGLGAATYKEIGHNYVVGSGFRYHQMRVTLSNVQNLSDARVESLVLKGLNLFGVGSVVPILRP